VAEIINRLQRSVRRGTFLCAITLSRKVQDTAGNPGRLIMASTTDYDAPRRPAVEFEEDSLEELKARRASGQSPTVDVDEAQVAEGFELPGADLSDEELTVKVVPMLSDEFRCSRCFLVHHRSQLVVQGSGTAICRECA
jgi:hypothetical protein